MLGFITRQGRNRQRAARQLYAVVMDHSRNPDFYGAYKIPDTLEGRFEVLALHAGLLVNRLSRPDMGKYGREMAQTFFDVMFRDLEWSLREMGVGDLGVPRRVKKMMTSFKGRTFAYDEAAKSGKSEIKHALIRNVYGKVLEPHNSQLEAMADYTMDCIRALDEQGLSDFYMGAVSYPLLDTLKLEIEDKNAIEPLPNLQQGETEHGYQQAA